MGLTVEALLSQVSAAGMDVNGSLSVELTHMSVAAITIYATLVFQNHKQLLLC
jgi:hypothetical protein